MKIFVIAGTQNEFQYYMRGKVFNKNYVYVSRSDTLRGNRDIHGVFIGTWRQRTDIVEILDVLITRTTNTDTIKDLYRQVIPRNIISRSPSTPFVYTKLEQSILDEVGGQIQKEIDNEILRNLISS
jgi:hypothetical protein